MSGTAFTEYPFATGRKRKVVASFATYPEAERAVDYLADQRYPVEHVSIVAEGVRLVEQVTGRATWLYNVGNGALTGAVAGALTGLLLGSFILPPLVSAFALAFNGLLFGLVVGAVLGGLIYAFSSGEREFTSVQGFDAAHYSIMADEEAADEAIALLAQRPPPKTASGTV